MASPILPGGRLLSRLGVSAQVSPLHCPLPGVDGRGLYPTFVATTIDKYHNPMGVTADFLVRAEGSFIPLCHTLPRGLPWREDISVSGLLFLILM
jgi:hypothetical protein